MDELTLLERMRADVEADPQALLRARRRLLRRAVGPVVRRRLALRLATVACAVAVVAVALVAAGIMLPGAGGADPAAAAVLDKAARDLAAEPAPARGEYLHVREVTTRWEDGRPVTYHQESWVPGDAGEPRVFRDSDGYLYRSVADPPEIFDDPRVGVSEVLAWLRRDNGDLRGDEAAYERVGEVLAADATPMRFKARLLEAVKHIDDVRVVDESADFHGVDAVIVGRVEPLQAQFAFERRTGHYLGMQAPPAPGADEPFSYSTRTFTTVVDRLPERARR